MERRHTIAGANILRFADAASSTAFGTLSRRNSVGPTVFIGLTFTTGRGLGGSETVAFATLCRKRRTRREEVSTSEERNRKKKRTNLKRCLHSWIPPLVFLEAGTMKTRGRGDEWKGSS
jgi:hypothetical protein